MIRVLNIETSFGNAQIYNLFADSKSEVTEPDSMHIEGLADTSQLTQGCSVLTAEGELAFLKSDKTWNWV